MENLHTATTTVVDTHPYATMRWGAIIGGWLVATGIASLMYVAGLALGFSAFDPYNAAATAKGIGIGTAIWMVLTWAVSLFLGGMFASWFDARADQTVGSGSITRAYQPMNSPRRSAVRYDARPGPITGMSR